MAQNNDIDLSNMSKSELKSLRKNVDKAIADHDERKKREALNAIKEAAQEHGFKLDDLLQDSKGRKTKAPSVAKYAHPENSSMTWTGKGRQPNWVKDYIGSGKDLDELLIDKSEKQKAAA